MTIIFLIGRIIFGGYFIMNGYNHFKNVGALAGYAGSKGVPHAKLSVQASGALLLIGGVSIVTGIWPGIGIISLLLFLVPVTFMMHPYWKSTDPQHKMTEHIQFMKNMALIGALLMLTFEAAAWPLVLFR